MTGADYIAEFLWKKGIREVFLITGGACAFIVDAIGRHKRLKYKCFQHEQAAAMAADASWRVHGKVGVTVVTSGPGATNLITGIACSFFDSIPTLHITGQVNQNEKLNYQGSRVRQAGFQETKIVEMVKPITKYAVQVTSGKQLIKELPKAFERALGPRMGPVLIDIPMDVQKENVGRRIILGSHPQEFKSASEFKKAKKQISRFFAKTERPLVLLGAGSGLSGGTKKILTWAKTNRLPFVASWNALTYFDHRMKNYFGHIGVYGNRGSNFLIQNCDRLLVLGSRLDNRQRSGNSSNFARNAKILAVDVDGEELKKYKNNSHFVKGIRADLKSANQLLPKIKWNDKKQIWEHFCLLMKKKYFGKNPSIFCAKNKSLSPYDVVKKINSFCKQNAVVIADDGANLCWVFQAFLCSSQKLFTAGGNSPMGYSFPAAIGAAFYLPKAQILAFTGDGSMQMNIQELQTLRHHRLNVKVIILNNFGYGIIKQFQDLYFGGRYHATGHGYSQPDFGKVASAYNIKYKRISTLSDLKKADFVKRGPMIFDITLDPNTQIEPKLELGRSLEDQYPYLSQQEYKQGMSFVPSNRRNL